MAATTALPSSTASSHPHIQPQTHYQSPAPSSSADSGTGTSVGGGGREDDDSVAFKAAIFQRLHPRVYLERFLAEDVRPDGRVLGTVNKYNQPGCGEGGIWRDVSINVGSINTADGSALVRMGGTTIVCGVKAEIAEPDLEKPDDGFLVPNIDLPAMCHPRFKPGPPSDEAQVLSERLSETLTSSNFISPQSLVIHSGKAVWTLYVDATCINYDGNVFDAALLAMASALMNTKLPKAVYDEDTGQTICHRQPTSCLSINGLPLSTTFGIFDSTYILTDPTAFEEPLLDGTITIITGEASASEAELLSVIQQGLGVVYPGSESDLVGENALSACITAAKARRRELAKIVRDAVAAGVNRQTDA
ncbi:Exosome complex component RRP43 [Leucoagaricus sp. SymC.cos]|nr:Exosome complex component RRP43 [Leucoagaricus sp. SymC.cos]